MPEESTPTTTANEAEDAPASDSSDAPLHPDEASGQLPPNMVMAWDGSVRYRTIHELLGLILAELPAIGKNSTAPSAIGGFKFRGIEAVKDALNPLLAKYGVFYVPDVVSRTTEEKRGKEHATTLHVRYTWYGPAGDSVSGSIWSEGMDTRDKGHQKALTSAEKYWLVQSLSIATEEQSGDDLDRSDSPEPGDEPPRRGGRQQQQAKRDPEPERATVEQVNDLMFRLLAVMDGEEYPEAWKAAPIEQRGPGRIETLQEMIDGARAPITLHHLAGANALLEQIETERRQSEPCQLCGSSRTNRVDVEGVWRCADPKGCEERAAKRAADSAAMEQASDAPFTEESTTPDVPNGTTADKG